MRAAIYTVCAQLVFWVAYARAFGVIAGMVRTLLRRTDFRTFRLGWVEAVTWLEPFLLGGLTYRLHTRWDAFAPVATARLVAVGAGAVLVVAACALLLWAFRSWPALFVGHAILPDHHLVTTGAYGVIRHPVYLAAFLVWLGLALAAASPAALLATTLYVVPTYLLYMRSEERMMLEAFGERYRTYCRTVPAVIPRPRALVRGSAPR